MARRSAFLRSLFVLATAVSLASCERISDVTAPFTGPSADLVASGSPFTLITEPVLAPVEVRTSALIGIEGGSLTLMGHTLTVPSGAVTVPTTFALVAPPSPHIDVHATATVTGLLGQVVNVGIFGFKKPVTLTLTYSRANNVTNPSTLHIVYFGDSGVEHLPSVVNQTAKTVTAQLHHFSKYGMCEN